MPADVGSAFLPALERVHDRLVFGRRARVLAREIACLVPTGRLVDVGCGSGEIARAVAGQREDVAPEGFDVLVRPRTAIPVTRFDGRRLPLADGAADGALLVDVLHHASDPTTLLAECARVARVVVVKDHLSSSARDGKVLAFMDWVGNRPHGVRLPYRFFTPESWASAVASCRLRETAHGNVADLYPWPFSRFFGGRLQFVIRLERTADSPLG